VRSRASGCACGGSVRFRPLLRCSLLLLLQELGRCAGLLLGLFLGADGTGCWHLHCNFGCGASLTNGLCGDSSYMGKLFISCIFAVGARVIGIVNSTCSCCCSCCGCCEILSCFIGQCLNLLLVLVVLVVVVALRLTAVTFAFVVLLLAVAGAFVVIVFVKNAVKVFPRALNLNAHARGFDSEHTTKTPEEKGREVRILLVVEGLSHAMKRNHTSSKR